MKQPGKIGISFRWLCFGLLLVASVCRLLSRGMLLPEAEAAVMREPAEESYPAFLYSLPEIPSLQFTPEEAALVSIDDRSGLAYDKEALLLKPLTLSPGDGPLVLIVHTHATEAYTPSEGSYYAATGSYRSGDTAYNVVRVGQAIADKLNARGIVTLHDTTLHDAYGYDDAYGRTAQTVAAYLEQYPSIQMVIDVHRDAVADSSGAQLAFCSQVRGQQAARLLFVMGTDASGQEHPNWQSNLSMALKLQVLCEKEAPGLFRELSLRNQRYNQHLTPYSLLLEVGTAGNTLPEALLSAEFFAEQLARLLLEGSR